MIYVKIKILRYSKLSKHGFKIKSPISIGKNFFIDSDLTDTKILIKENCRIRDNFHVHMANGGVLKVGKDCFFNNNCSITCLTGIEIGDHTQVGENVLFYDHNHRFSDEFKLISQQGYNTDPIKIGRNCWIGSNVVILKGVEIGDNVVVGAGCVIFESVPSDTVVINHQNLVIKRKNNSDDQTNLQWT